LAEGYYAALDAAHFDGAGVPGVVLATRGDVVDFPVLDGWLAPIGSVPVTLFPNEKYPGTSGRMVLGAAYDRFFAAFEGGTAFEGAWEPIEGTPPLPALEVAVEPPHTQPEFFRCADAPTGRICVFTSPADRRLHVFEAADAVTQLLTFDVTGIPGDPAIALHDADGKVFVRIAAPSESATYQLFEYELGAE